MDAADFARLTRPLPEPCLLVSREGVILAANAAALRALGVGDANLVGSSLLTACADTTGAQTSAGVRAYLARCAASGEFLPGSLRLARPDGEVVRYRCEAALVRPAAGGEPALLLLRLRLHQEAAHRFVALNQKIEALAREIQERRRAEEELQTQAVQLEENAAELELMIDELERQKEEAQQARGAAERATDRIAALQRVTAALSQAVTTGQIAAVVVDEAAAAIAARAAVVGLVAEDGESLEIVREFGSPSEALQRWRGLGDATPLGDAVARAETIYFRPRDERFASYAGLPSADPRLPRGALAVVPLLGGSGPLGGLVVELPEGRDLAEDDGELVAAIARQGALAIERARLFEAERDARALVTAAARRVGVLAEAGSLLSSSLDPRLMLEELVSLCVATIADVAAAYLLQNDHSLVSVGTAYSEALGEGSVRALERLLPLDAKGGRGPGVVASNGASVLIPDLRVAELDPPQRELYEQATLRLRSAAVVPLQARGRTLGAMTLATTEGGAVPYAQEDLGLIEELARRAAIAVDNARLLHDAQEANRAKADFLAVMSHELRTPLNAIVGYVDLLDAEVAGPVSAGQRQQLARIQRGARHLVTIIDDILEFARLEAGRERINLEHVDLAELAREAADLIEPAVAQQGLSFVVEIPTTSVPLDTDPAKARQILLNLLSNAVKFTEAGEVGLAVVLEAEEVTCRVWDTGLGIGPDDLEHIFEPFWQVQRGTTRRAGGTGLGLTVTRRLAQLLGGDLSVASEPGSGSTFTLRLPHPATLAAPETPAAV